MLRYVLPSILALILTACGGDAACPTQTQAFVKTSVAWPQGRVFYCWENLGTVRGGERKIVHDVTQELAASAAVSFEDVGACAAGEFQGLKIFVADLQPQAAGLGVETRGVHAGLRLNTTFKNWGEDCLVNEGTRLGCVRTIAMHEMLHVLGFAHEHNRHDTPASCAAAKQGGDGELRVGSWDAHSATNYCNETWSNDGRLSSGDVAGLVAMYGAKDVPKAGVAARPAASNAAAVCR